MSHTSASALSYGGGSSVESHSAASRTVSAVPPTKTKKQTLVVGAAPAPRQLPAGFGAPVAEGGAPKHVQSLVRQLCSCDPTRRPTAEQLLNDPRLPRKRLHRDVYREAIPALVDSANREGHRRELLRQLFAQPNDEAAIKLFDKSAWIGLGDAEQAAAEEESEKQ